MKRYKLIEEISEAWLGQLKKDYFRTGIIGWDIKTIPSNLIAKYAKLNEEKAAGLDDLELVMMIEEMLELDTIDELIEEMLDKNMVDYDCSDYYDEEDAEEDRDKERMATLWLSDRMEYARIMRDRRLDELGGDDYDE